MTKRRRLTAEFKARVALEALRGDRTIQEIAARISPVSGRRTRPSTPRMENATASERVRRA